MRHYPLLRYISLFCWILLTVSKQFKQIIWNEAVEEDCRQIVRLAVREDLDRLQDWTTVALVPQAAQGRADLVARKPGVIAGLPALRCALDEMNTHLECSTMAEEGSAVEAGQTIARLEGSARNLLTAERLILNLLGRLSGIASVTKRYVDAVAGMKAKIYDTRKTTPAWRRLEKYAVGCGGGCNHRTGLFDAVLIKDNHLALGDPTHAGEVSGPTTYSPASAVAAAKQFIQAHLSDLGKNMIIEIEVDTLEQLDEVLQAGPDIVLLDNMNAALLCQAVARRDASNRQVQLEASGGVNLETVAEIAKTGVDRISVGALTHSAPWLDIGLDWIS